MRKQFYEPHPLAELMPTTDDIDYRRIRDDIQTHGQKMPLILFEGKILDGRTRYKACLELNIPPQITVFDGSTLEAVNLVASHNFYRRHLSTSQKAIVGSRLARQIAEEEGLSKKESQRLAAAVVNVTEDMVSKADELPASGAKRILNGKTTVAHEHDKLVTKRDPFALQRRSVNDACAAIGRLVCDLTKEDGDPCNILGAAEDLLVRARAMRHRWDDARERLENDAERPERIGAGIG